MTSSTIANRPRVVSPSCHVCEPPKTVCDACRNARRREIYAKDHAITRGGRHGAGPAAYGVAHVRCDGCREAPRQCGACYNDQRNARHAARLAADATYAAKTREYDRGKRARAEANRAAGRKMGAPCTIPRCAECPPTGSPCRPCLNAHKRKYHAARRADGMSVRVKAPGLVKPRAPRAKSLERAEANRVLRETKKAAAAEMVAAKAAQKVRSQEAAGAGILAEIQREARLSTCQVCQARGRFDGAFCRRHAGEYVAPADLRKAPRSYTSNERSA